MPQIRVAIFDDHAVFRKVLRIILEKQHDLTLVAEADNGLTAVEMVDEHRPDVVLMDINMPVVNGLDATGIITSKYPRTRVVILSMHSDDGVRVRAKEVGASHFLSKDCQPKGLIT